MFVEIRRLILKKWYGPSRNWQSTKMKHIGFFSQNALSFRDSRSLRDIQKTFTSRRLPIQIRRQPLSARLTPLVYFYACHSERKRGLIPYINAKLFSTTRCSFLWHLELNWPYSFDTVSSPNEVD